MKASQVYLVSSLVQSEFLVFGTRERAEKFIQHFDRDIFDKSSIDDLFVTTRIVF